MPLQSTVSPAETVRNHPDTEIVAKMDPALKAKWIAMLRDGEYEQARNTIGDVSMKQLCCLGVGAVAANLQIALSYTSDAIAELSKHGFVGWDGTDKYSPISKLLINMNDKDGKSFAEIADYIEANL